MGRVADTVGRKLRYVRRRCDLNEFLQQCGLALAAGGTFAGLVVLVERATSAPVPMPAAIWAMLSGAFVAGAVMWVQQRPTTMQVALLIDERERLKERFSSALSLTDRDDAFSQATVRQACESAEKLVLRRHFPVRLSGRWVFAAAAWAVVAGLYLFMPSLDLFGRDRARLAKAEADTQLQQAAAEVKQVTSKVQATVSQLNDSDLADQLAELDKTPLAAQADQARREAIRKLGDISDRLKEKLSGEDFQSARMMKSMLGDLRTTRSGLSDELTQALARGDYSHASEMIRQLAKQLGENKMSPEDRHRLQKQLSDMARQLADLADKNDPLAEELEKLGLDKDLAKLPKSKLRQALKQMGLTDKQIDDLLSRTGAAKRACASCAGLGQAMGSCCGGAGGLSADELDELAGMLDELEAMKMQMALCEAGLDEIYSACMCLGEGCCEGAGYGPWREGLSMRQGRGSGGPGRGYGARESDETGDASTYKSRAKTKTKQGPVVASWYMKGSQIKGESRRELTGAVQAAKDRAAEAITDNTIPKRYESSVKKYFTQLEERTEK